jgi:hypothetical protein
LIKSNFFTELTVASRFSRSDERTAVFAKASTCSVEMFFSGALRTMAHETGVFVSGKSDQANGDPRLL